MYNNIGTELEYLDDDTSHGDKLKIILNGLSDTIDTEEEGQDEDSKQVDYKKHFGDVK